MAPKRKSKTQNQLLFEQIALLFTSFVWTLVVLSPLVIFWAIQDMEANWDVIMAMQAEATAESPLVVYVQPSATPSPTPSATPTATLTPEPAPPEASTPTPSPSPTPSPTLAIEPPGLLPDTPNLDDPTPIPIQANEAANGPDTLSPSATPTVTPSPSPTPSPTPQANPVEDTPTPLPPTATPTPTAIPTDTPAPSAETLASSAQAPQAGEAGVPSLIEIPSVGITSDVIPVGWKLVEQDGQRYSIWDVADYAVGWHNTTARIGQIGNTVMAGHHNINGEVFRDLVNVEVGDEIIVHTSAGEFIYQVELKTIVKEKGEPIAVRQENAKWIAPTTDERITMVTCWPYTNNTHRVIVVAKPNLQGRS